MKKVYDFLKGFLIVNVLWYLLSHCLSVSVLPGPITVYSHFAEVVDSGIFIHIGTSLARVAGGLFLSLCAGIPTGLLMAMSKTADRLLHPLVYFSYPVPKTALLPVLMLLMGLGNGSKILIIILTTVFQVVVAVRDAAAGIDPGIYYVARSSGAGTWIILRNITFPAIGPEVFTGIRIGIGTSLAILLIVEAYGTRYGIGYFILDSWSRINYIQMYGGIVVMSVVGAALFLLLDLLEGRVCGWKVKCDN